MICYFQNMGHLERIALGASLFLAGAAFDHFWLGKYFLKPAIGVGTPLGIRANPGVLPVERVAKAQKPRNSPVLTTNFSSLPSAHEKAKPALAQFDTDLEALIQNDFPSATTVEKTPNADGTWVAHEETEDGSVGYRHFSARDELISENWKLANGDDLFRSYYNGGGVKSFTLKRIDGSTTSVTLFESGLYEGRFDEMADGSRVATSYDGLGQLSGKWQIGKNGESTKIED